ncbi:uncharacterized protein LACBIDRAFT_315253 [Laccaria bicolor S238N-H82]|uniref:Predicted protein n=1 Tax=Laccaria bicolor (strain S238N-H82 / ATCC MYA-4686) TaxID=486041 RepID=B0E067_LACBS|nr:uncharacterized protein LACBIDRAFT_315253 [Laccaria bicolor S238N-H82]EDQ99769.1 predicted protein [Laccaria bicolor S238N-H82]|eukprot:XP_001889605.1 predicted protein [Laccaria bicolor S238N-H82]
MMRLSKSRAQQPATKGFRRVFHSPKKRRNSCKTSTQVTYLGQVDKLCRVQEVLARLLADPGEEEDDEGGDECEGSMEVPGDLGNSGSGFAWGEGDRDGDGDDFSMPDNGIDVDLCPSTPQKSDPIPPKTPIPAKVQRTGPDAEANLLYQQWQALIPRLVSPFLSFISATHGKKTFPLNGPFLYILLADFDTFEVTSCECQDIMETLILHGLFPTSPTQPWMAVSIILIQHYNTLFECAWDAVYAYSHAVNLVYGCRGFVHRNYQGEIIQDAFRQGLGHAIQWYDSLQVQIEQELKAATVAGDATTPCSSETNLATITTPEAPIPKQLTPDYSLAEPPLSLVKLTPDDSPPEHPVPLVECARVLQQRCPACFGLRTFGCSGAMYV